MMLVSAANLSKADRVPRSNWRSAYFVKAAPLFAHGGPPLLGRAIRIRIIGQPICAPCLFKRLVAAGCAAR